MIGKDFLGGLDDIGKSEALKEHESNQIHRLIDELLKKEAFNKDTKYEPYFIKLAIEYNQKQFLLNKVPK